MSATPNSPAIHPDAGSSTSNALKPAVNWPDDPIDPWPVLLFRWAQHALIVALHRLFHDSQGKAGYPKRRQALRLGRPRRRQRGDARIDACEIIENHAGIHQCHAVIGKEGRRFQERVELRELINVPKERNWPMYKRSFGHDQRNGDPAHVGRIKHSDQLHEISSLKRRLLAQKTAKTQGATGRWKMATGARELALAGALRGN